MNSAASASRAQPSSCPTRRTRAHDRACEAQLALVLADDLDQRRLPDLNALLLRFAPDPARLPDVLVHLASLSSYDVLVDSGAEVAA